MLKKTLFALLTVIVLLSFSSCLDRTPEVTHAPETTEKAPEAPVMHSFYTIGYGYKPGYVVLTPAEDSEEARLWNRICLTNYTDGEICPGALEGESIEVVYSGEIESMSESSDISSRYTFGYIKDVHSMKIKVDPREYNGVKYGVAVLGEGPSRESLERHGGTVGEDGNPYMRIEGMLQASNRDEFAYLAENCIVGKVISTSRYETDQMKESLARLNQRYRLLDGYDDEFFCEYDLLMISIFACSGSMRFDVTDIAIDSGICTLTVEITEMPATDDIGDWTLLVSIPKEMSATITEYKTYTPKPEWARYGW